MLPEPMSKTPISRRVAAWLNAKPRRGAAAVVPFAVTGRKLAPVPADFRSPKSGDGVVAGLLAKREDSLRFFGNGKSSPSVFRDSAGVVVELDLEDLVHTTVAVFRAHPHLNNVLTHICGARWERIGIALSVICNPLSTPNDLSPLARNIVELMCAERGITGRILKPFFHALLDKVLPAQTAAYLGAHIWQLFMQMEARGTDCSPLIAESGGDRPVAGGG